MPSKHQTSAQVEGAEKKQASHARKRPRGGKQLPGELRSEPEVLETDPVEGSEEFLPSRKGLLQSAGVVFIILTHVMAFMAGYYLPPPQREAPSLGQIQESEVIEEPLSQAVQRLGDMPANYMDDKQARDLLALMVSHPGRKIYELHFTRAGRRVVLTSDLTNQMLTRTTVQPDGSGSTTFWEGSVFERLQAAAGGGSFNLASAETPTGKTTHFASDLAATGGIR